MSKSIIRFAALAAIAASLSACGTLGVGPSSDTLTAAGASWNAASGATLGYLHGNHSADPTAIKDSKGVIQHLTVSYCFAQQNAVDYESVASGNASATATTSGAVAGNAAPSLQVASAVNEGLNVGLPAVLDKLAELQAAAGPSHDVLADFAAMAKCAPTGAAASAQTP